MSSGLFRPIRPDPLQRPITADPTRSRTPKPTNAPRKTRQVTLPIPASNLFYDANAKPSGEWLRSRFQKERSVSNATIPNIDVEPPVLSSPFYDSDLHLLTTFAVLFSLSHLPTRKEPLSTPFYLPPNTPTDPHHFLILIPARQWRPHPQPTGITTTLTTNNHRFVIVLAISSPVLFQARKCFHLDLSLSVPSLHCPT